MVSSTSALRRLSPLEHRAAGGAALARPRHLEVDSAHRRDEPPQVGAVAAVDPLGLALPLLGADQGPDLLLQDDLQGDPDRALAEDAQISAEVLLRRQFKLGNLVHRKLLGLAAKRGRSGLDSEELPLPLQPPRTSDSHNLRDTTRSTRSSRSREPTSSSGSRGR